MEIYLVGGAVRDALLGYPHHENDWVVVGATAEELVAQGFKPVGKDFPVFLHPQTGEEYALARTERKTAPGYAGFVFHSDPSVTLEQDLIRRDLTINAIAQTKDGKLVDPYEGAKDLQHKCLRHVSAAFSEDPVRILRIARFQARYQHLGFSIADETLTLMKSMVAAGEVDHLVPERVWKELESALGEKNPEAFIETLLSCNALSSVMPELTQPEAVNLFHDFCTEQKNTLGRFAALTFTLTSQEAVAKQQNIQRLCERLGAPKDYRDLALMTAAYLPAFCQTNKLPPKKLTQLLKNLDAYRRTDRFNLWLDTCQTLANVIPGLVAQTKAINGIKTADNPAEQFKDTLRKVFAACQTVSAQTLMATGITGKELGVAIENQREQLIQTLLTGTPEND